MVEIALYEELRRTETEEDLTDRLSGLMILDAEHDNLSVQRLARFVHEIDVVVWSVTEESLSVERLKRRETAFGAAVSRGMSAPGVHPRQPLYPPKRSAND